METRRSFLRGAGAGLALASAPLPSLLSAQEKVDHCVCDEPGIYIRGEFGVRLEDDVLITENGAELFTGQSPSLEQPFAKS